MTEGSPALVVRHEQAVTTLVLNRPDQLNAIDGAMAMALIDEIGRVAGDPGCRCLLITGAGRAFCAGQALGTGGGQDALPPDIEGLIRERYVPVVLGLRRLEIPVVAAVNGLAVGAGLSLALAADLRLADESSWFSCGFAQIGLVPDSGATYFLPRLLGPGRGLYYAITGERISASKALEMGLVDQVFPSASFAAETRGFAARLASSATRALGLTKLAMNQAQGASLEEQLELEARLQQEASLTEDFQEGLRAFRERRQPQFRGR